MTDFLLLATVFLVAGVAAVPLASRLGLGSVLGYLIAGVVIAPVLRGLGVDVVAIQHFAEFGVVMMLFLVGLELEPKMLWNMRAKLLGLGGMQVLLTTVAVGAVAIAFGIAWQISITIGMILALSSTAIVLQTLGEKGLMKSDGGQSSFSVLLFQDIAVIPMLAFIPLLAIPEVADYGKELVAHAAPAGEHIVAEDAHADSVASHGATVDTGDAHGAAADDHSGGDHGSSLSLVDGLPSWAAALVTLGAIAFVGIGGAVLTGPVFRYVEMAKLRELFTATALMFVIGIALLMSLVGLSPALGTFLAGVVLANSEYRHELESDIDPFRGLLLGLFFMTVGASVDFGLLFDNLGSVLGMTLGLMALKTVVLLILARSFKLQGSDKWLFGLGLAQAGEFGFVLISFTVSAHVLPQVIADQLLLVVALSMMLTPLLFIVHEKVIVPRSTASGPEPEAETPDESRIIIAGHGRFGGIVNRMLLAAGHKPTVLDYSSSQLDMLRRFGFRAFYGDATRPDLLHAAGIAEADVFVVAIDNEEQATEVVRYVRANYPKVHIVARALNRHHVYELYAAGANDMIRDTFDSSVRAGRSVYEAIGMHPYEAEKLAQTFVKEDTRTLREAAPLYDPEIPISENTAYQEKIKELRQEADDLMSGNTNGLKQRTDRGWNPPSKDMMDAILRGE